MYTAIPEIELASQNRVAVIMTNPLLSNPILKLFDINPTIFNISTSVSLVLAIIHTPNLQAMM